MGSELPERLSARLGSAGLNLVGVADPLDYDARVATHLRLRTRWPRARAAMVVGSGGHAFWDACRGAGSDRLDAFAEKNVTRALGEAGAVDAIVLYPHRFAETPVAFVELAECAGLGVRSLLGILIRPDYGPWFALRAAILIDEPLQPSPPLHFDPCPSCHKPCIAACPAGAISAKSGWDVPICATHRLRESDCADGCWSRIACVYGCEHRYADDEQRHHQGHALEMMRQRLLSGSVSGSPTRA